MVFIKKFKFENFYGSVLYIMITEVWEKLQKLSNIYYHLFSKHTLKKQGYCVSSLDKSFMWNYIPLARETLPINYGFIIFLNVYRMSRR